MVIRTDHWLWVYLVPRLIPLYIHYSTHSIRIRILASVPEHVHSSFTSALAESGHTTHVTFDHLNYSARPTDRRQQAVSHYPRTGYYQIVCHLQRS